MPDFDDLPFNTRPDLTPYLLHLTKNSIADDECSAYDNLVKILKAGEIRGSSRAKGKIKGAATATCFMDIPFASLKYILTPENTKPTSPRYEPYGVAITKKFGYRYGCRPVLYLSNKEIEQLAIPASEYWRVVRFEVINENWISWLHEREWRAKGNFRLPSVIQAAFVRTTKEASKLTALLHKSKGDFECRPRSVLPLTVVSQGLLR